MKYYSYAGGYNRSQINKDAWKTARELTEIAGGNPRAFIGQASQIYWDEARREQGIVDEAVGFLKWVLQKAEIDLAEASRLIALHKKKPGKVCAALGSVLLDLRSLSPDETESCALAAMEHKHRLETDFTGSAGADEYASNDFDQSNFSAYIRKALDLQSIINKTSSGEWAAKIELEEFSI